MASLKSVYHLTSYQQNKCDELFSAVQIGDFIYPGHLKSKLGISIKTAYQFMESLKSKGFVKNIYEVYCTNCGKSKGIFLETLSDFNEDLACDFCNTDLSVTDDIIVLYKVIHI